MSKFPVSALRAAVLATLASVAGAAFATEYGTVVSATPVTAQVPVPQSQCTEQQAEVQRPPSGGGALLGAIVGGAVGNAVGSGFGRAAATGLGLVAGSVIGNNVEAANTPPVPTTLRSCRTVTGYENRLVGYDVVYDYNGMRYAARLAQAPGPTLALNVGVSMATGATVVTPEGAIPATAAMAAAAPVAVPAQTVVYTRAPAYGYGYYGYGGPVVTVAPQVVIGGRYWRRW